jgi:hypothetical protein
MALYPRRQNYHLFLAMYMMLLHRIEMLMDSKYNFYDLQLAGTFLYGSETILRNGDSGNLLGA